MRNQAMSEQDSLENSISSRTQTPLFKQVTTEYAHPTNNGTYGLYSRWQVYKYADDPVDFDQEAFKAVNQTKPALLIDVGCSDGANLISQRLAGSYENFMVGIDIHPDIFSVSAIANAQMKSVGIKPVHFISAKAEAMPFDDSGFDAAMCLFMLYHVPNPLEALKELHRVVKPLGKIAISTSGSNNKSKQRKYERLMADYMNVDFPTHFNRTFDTTVADSIIPTFFTVESTIIQDCNVSIFPEKVDHNPSSMKAFMASLDSMRIHFSPIPTVRKWEKAKRAVLYPEIHTEINEKGHVSEHILRKLYVCINDFDI